MRFSIVLASLFIVIATALPAAAAPTMAFGYLANKKGDPNNNYLETIFPNAFANSIKNIFEVSILKPAQIEKLLQKHNRRLEKDYRPQDLPQVASQIGADYFIFGSFMVLPNDRITINLNLYARGLNKVFSFSNTGTMETEIFKLVDRITQIMVHFMGSGNYYRARVIPPGSRIGVITNLDGPDLNYLYATLLSRRYIVSAIQANNYRNTLNGEWLSLFKNITARDNSYDLVTDARSFRVLYGTWGGQRYQQYTTYMLRMYRIYDADYLTTKFAALDRMAKDCKVDYLLIVGFEGRNLDRAWVRCIDIKSRDLVWLQKDIKGGFTALCQTVTEQLSAPLELKKDGKKTAEARLP